MLVPAGAPGVGDPASPTVTCCGVAFALVFAVAIIYAPPLQSVFKTAALPTHDLLVLTCFPLVAWGSDELWRWRASTNTLRSESRHGESRVER